MAPTRSVDVILARPFKGNDILDSSTMAFNHVVGSAAGAGFNSHGRKAVELRPQDEFEARRADIDSLRN